MCGVMLSGYWALIPLKAAAEAKSRLSPALDVPERAGLRHAMLRDLMKGLVRSELLSGIAVYGPEPEFPATTPGIRQVGLQQASHVRDMSMASTDGARTLAGMGAEIIAVIPGDLPLVDGRELDAAFAEAEKMQGTIVIPDRHGTGTNGMVFPAGSVPCFQFGSDSFGRHCEPVGRGAGARAMPLASFAIDIDTPADLAAFCRQSRINAGLHTQSFISARLPSQATEFCSTGVMQ